MGVVQVGMHVDVIISDDLHSERNTTTSEQIQKVIDHYKLMSAVLEPGGVHIVLGTMWHYMDLYNYIIENEAERFEIMIESAIRPDGSLFFPQRLTAEFLEEQKKILGPFMFSLQYQNQPVNDDTARFKRSWLEKCFYRKGEEPNFHDQILIIDPAISTEKQSDYSAFVTLQMDARGDIWVTGADHYRLEAHKIVDKIFDYVTSRRIGTVVVETNIFQKFLKFSLKQEMAARKMFFPIREVKASTRTSKDYRISALAPAFESGQIRIRRDMTDLIDEYLRYPKAAHDDLLDALSYSLEVLRPYTPGEYVQEKSRASFYDQYYAGR